jgi:hypothetical protein
MQNRVESLRRIKEPISKAYPKPQTASCKISSKLGSGGPTLSPLPPPTGVQFAGFCLWFSLPLHDGHCQQGRARTSQPASTKPSAPQHHPTMGCICTTCQPFTHNHHLAMRVSYLATWGICILTIFYSHNQQTTTLLNQVLHVPLANHLLTTTTKQ